MIPPDTCKPNTFDFGEVGKWHPWMDVFIEKLSVVGLPGIACREISKVLKADIHLHHVVPHKYGCEKFNERWCVTLVKSLADIIENGLGLRAAYGTEKAIYYKGNQCGTETVWDNKCSQWFLGVLNPKYAPKTDDGGKTAQESVQALTGYRSDIDGCFNGGNGNRLN